jgi:hypothetical protein
VVVVRDEEWFVRATEDTADGLLVHVQGLGELVRDTTASFYASLDNITPLDPAKAKVVPDSSPRYRTARLWLDSTFRKPLCRSVSDRWRSQPRRSPPR